MLQLDGFPTGDGVKADRPAGRLTVSMMELQTLQEALKVEIQIHQKLVAQMKQDPQNADLKKQLHELQAKITALSEKQKKVVEQLRKELLVKQEPETKLQLNTQPPGGDSIKQAGLIPGVLQQTLTVTKTLPLVLKAAQRPATVAMVTTAMVTNTKTDQSPISLVEPVRLMSKNALVVRPKPATPTNVPIAPAPPPPMMAAPQLLQRPVMLATKLTSSSLPSNAPIHQVRIVNGQPLGKTGALTGIVITTPVNSATRFSSPAKGHNTALIHTHTANQPIQISSLHAEHKTVKAGSGLEHKTLVGLPSSSTPPLSPALTPALTPALPPALPPALTPALPRPKREDDPEVSPQHGHSHISKLAFMVSLGLVTHDHLEEIQSKRQERKRRTTANPVYSGAVFEPERKKSAVSYLNSPLHQGTRKRGRPPKYSSALPELGMGLHTPTSPSIITTGPSVHPLPMPSPNTGDGDIHEDFCTVCRRSGQLLMCDTCSRVFHLDCLDPPLKTIPKGMWICPRCQDQILKKEEAIPWPGTLAIVHSYIAYKEAKEEEKLKLMKWSSELKLEREQLEQRVKLLSNSITKCMETKNTILARQKDMQLSLDKVKHLIRLIQAFNFNQALAETEESTTRVQDCPKTDSSVCPEANAPPEEKINAISDSNSVEKVKAIISPLNADTNDQQVENGSVRGEEDKTLTGVSAGGENAETPEDSGVQTADNSPDLGTDEEEIDKEVEDLKVSEVVATPPPPETELATPAVANVDIPVSPSLDAVAITNGTMADPISPEKSNSPVEITEGCTAPNVTNNNNNNSTVSTNSEIKISAVSPPEKMEVFEKKTQDDNIADIENTINSKTSELSQHSLPALVVNSSLDDKK